MKRGVTAAAIGILFCASLLFAQEKAKTKELKDRVEIPGTIVCIGCTIEKEYGADAQCTLHAKHAQGLAMADGPIWTFVDNARGHFLITNDQLRGKEVKIMGWKYPKSQYIEVSRYQVKEGDKWIAYDYCKTCGFEKGDYKDSGLCDECRGN